MVSHGCSTSCARAACRSTPARFNEPTTPDAEGAGAPSPAPAVCAHEMASTSRRVRPRSIPNTGSTSVWPPPERTAAQSRWTPR
jgi:hypothetical protein